ncbi:carbohydrate ABC transporter substrate-binding protein [Phycicoccus sp. BSK3Z-2]|uniref:Carbohydrate ABC transporter substrate-binding protein n=1 Tax=Phycicoccus avicenniae TaxID=2828860 RepID=A0A941D5P6_9MICO|nr:ABC transporter substrate-binding protein [Phycicoccus avicenniae]MBR7742048.1 carbohydrate ABC transporter substrate-binding protein [Phycicoccus avicenniae]
MKTARTLPALLVGAALLLPAACSDPGASTADTGSGDSAAAEWPEATADLAGTELTIWAAQNSNTVPEAVVAAFEEATGASVEVETIPDPYEQSVQTRVATGDKPDLAFWQPTGSQLSALNATQNLQPLDDAPYLENYKPELRDLTGMLDDTRYAALIKSPAVIGVYYNKEVLEENGITETPTSFDDMVETGRELQEAGVTPFFEMGGDRWATQWWVQVQLADAAADGLWDEINANETSFTDPVVLDTIDTYQGLVEDGLFNEDYKTATFEDEGDALLAGDVAMVVQVNSFFGQLQSKADTAELDEKIGYFPISPGGNVGTNIPDQSNALVAFATGDDDREAAARQLLNYWLSEGYPTFVEDQQTVSLQTEVPNPDGVPEALISENEALADSVGSMQSLAVANPDLYIYLADMLQGATTPQEVAEQTQAQFAELARAQGVEAFDE